MALSRAPHGPRPVGTGVTVGLAALTALVTIWLGALAHVGGVSGPSAAVPERLAVVRVQPGENLQRLAARVAPDAATADVVERIKELNELDCVALDAGQTLIAPVE